jgi:DNA repair protein RadC
MPRHPPYASPPPGVPDYRAIMESFAAYVEAERPDLSSPKKVADLLRPVFADKMQEECHVLLLDTRNRLIRDEVVTVGLADRSQLHSREVFRAAIRCEVGCTRIILVHSHPSGDPTPSPQDIAVTRQIAEAGRIVGIELVDHVILGRKSVSRDRDYLSLREAGEMSP